MKRRHLFATPLLALTAFVSCAGTPPPVWVENAEAVYPSAAYIAVRGTSGSRETLEQDALRALSLYFEAQVSSQTELAESYREENGAVSQSASLDQRTLVQSETRLFAVRYAEPWQNSSAKTWETVAYIDRAEAWAVFEPRLASQTAPFMALHQAAEADPDPMRRYLRYRAAAACDIPALSGYLDFGRILNPARAALAELSQRLNQARFDASVYIDCPADLDGILRAAGVLYNPEITLALNGRSGEALVSMTLKAPRQSAVNPDIVRRRAYTALAGEIDNKFRMEFENQITVK